MLEGPRLCFHNYTNQKHNNIPSFFACLLCHYHSLCLCFQLLDGKDSYYKQLYDIITQNNGLELVDIDSLT